LVSRCTDGRLRDGVGTAERLHARQRLVEACAAVTQPGKLN
jgi:hypothetical protein